MLAALASGYHGPPELTFGRAFTSWTLDPWTAAAIVLLGGLYLLGVRRVRGSGGRRAAARAVLFFGLCPGVGGLATQFFVRGFPPGLFFLPALPTPPLLLVLPLFLAPRR